MERAGRRVRDPDPETGPARRQAGLARRLLSPHRSELRPPSSNCGGDALCVYPVMVSPELLRSVVDVLVGDAEDLEIDARATFGEQLADCRAEASCDDVLFEIGRASCRERVEVLL